eukprot:CAMPEP_0197854178 /NCGR_PEP_ID=MMETSP1438-20131217/24165_1 /TAXON_ID=1461541 /ORGANISM="Pterosperma sp., Strain CCMP1384" /LENGTH=405 /DNA_ID=CAMNT_0043468825 /DNA_START=73 /DNA_END=1290 /DNA_ORIENTATION=+
MIQFSTKPVKHSALAALLRTTTASCTPHRLALPSTGSGCYPQKRLSLHNSPSTHFRPSPPLRSRARGSTTPCSVITTKKTPMLCGLSTKATPEPKTLAPEVVEITERKIDLDGRITLNVREAGGDGPLVVMVHGFPESSYSWRHQLKALAAAGYKAVAYDQRGYGASDKPEDSAAYNIAELCKDCKELIGALGYENAVVVGHDWGSVIQWNMCLFYPEVVTATASLSVPFTERQPQLPTIDMKEKYGDDFYILKFQEVGMMEDLWMKDVRKYAYAFFVGPHTMEMQLEDVELPDWLTEEDIDQWVECFEKSGFVGPLNYYRNMNRNWELTKDVQPEGKQITIPTLVMMGDGELQFLRDAASGMGDRVPNLTYKEVADCGHWIQQEKPQQVNEGMLEWLQQYAPVK